MTMKSKLLAMSFALMLLPVSALAQASGDAAAPAAGQAPQGANATGDDAIYCRPPQERADSRLKGPKVCMTVKKWNDLRRQGLDVSADGNSIVQGAIAPNMGAP